MREAYYEQRTKELEIRKSYNIDFPAHFHESLEIFYMRKGSTQVMIENHSMEMQSGDLALIFPNCIHSYTAVQNDEESCALLMIVQPELIGEYRQLLTEMTPENPFLTAAQLHPDVCYALSSLDAEGETVPNLRAQQALLQLILSRTLPLFQMRNSPTQNSLLFQVVRILSAEYREPVTLDDLASRLCVSRYTISRLFSEKLGCGFPEYVNRLRLSDAENMLLHTRESVTEISFQCGFETPRTFNRVFLKHRGMTPREFRKKGIQI